MLRGMLSPRKRNHGTQPAGGSLWRREELTCPGTKPERDPREHMAEESWERSQRESGRNDPLSSTGQNLEDKPVPNSASHRS